MCYLVVYVARSLRIHSLRDVSRDPQTVVAYDNYNFLDTVRDQALGVKSRLMRNMTTAILVKCPHLPGGGLNQSMLNPVVPLDGDALLNSPNMHRDSVWKNATIYLLSEAIRSVHGSSVDRIFEGPGSTLPAFPVIDRLDHSSASQVKNLGAIYHDEGTIAGTYEVHNDIWLKQFGYSDEIEDRHFEERLWMVWGDQKTAELIRSLRKQQAAVAERSYERRSWMLGPPAYFHILQSLTYLLVRTHWSNPSGLHSPHNILHDISYWSRDGLDENNVKYHIIDPLVRASWNSRILSLFYEEMARLGFLRAGTTVFTPSAGTNTPLDEAHDDAGRDGRIEHTLAEYDRAICGLSVEQYMGLLESVRKVFTFHAWQGDGDSIGNYTTLCRFLQEGEVFLLMRHAVKAGDIGWIRRLIDILVVMFYGSEQHKYGYELLHLRWMLSDNVATHQLQRAILASGLVNIQGRRDSFIAIDLVLEHINCMYKLDMRNRKNSTHDVRETFDIVALTSSFNLSLRAYMEDSFGERTDTKHSTRSVVRDVFALAVKLWQDHACQKPLSSEPLLGGVPSSPDILDAGMNTLPVKVMEFNAKSISRTGFSGVGLDDTSQCVPLTAEEEFADITAHVEACEDELWTCL